ncbi:K02A2.6-like [Cordylochernes scorpioides]|uniref:K02A2.6-like n=1 Tax=Cordylochernes scorpioides TaxID=51811 RepID=A0ABY6L657_9ARAC|nr:K02A2.6-like [Cordylochernes scorpioides]
MRLPPLNTGLFSSDSLHEFLALGSEERARAGSSIYGGFIPPLLPLDPYRFTELSYYSCVSYFFVCGHSQASLCLDHDCLYSVRTVKSPPRNRERTPDPIKIEVYKSNDKILSLEYDTGSAYSLISDSTRRFFKLPNPCPADPLRVKLATYSGQPLQVLGTLDVPVQYQNSTQTLPLMVIEGEGPSLCGRNWMEALGILPTQPYKVDMIKVTENNLPTQLPRFRELFKPGYGVFKGIRTRLLVDPEMKPRFFKLRPIPYALKENISRELDGLIKAGILKPVRHAEWAASIVPVLKSYQTIRICGDFKITANQALIVDQYPLHKAEDIFAALAGGEKFSKIDLRDAYNQLELDDESQLYTVINTHQGLYKYTRLPFGIISAPALFQKQMGILLKELPWFSVH